MSLIKHSCANCEFDLEFPEQLERVCCPRCNMLFLVEVFEEVVILKRLKEERQSPLADTAPITSKRDLDSDLKVIDQKIDLINRQLRQRRSSASSSLSVAFLFFFFSLAGLLVDRALISVCCGTITTAMIVVAGGTLRESARTRDSLTMLLKQREKLLKELRPNIPRIF